MLERVHRKILRTIQGLPVRCPSVALTSLLGSRDISSFISQQQLTFINSIASMSTTDLPRLILEQRLTNPLLSGIIPLWQQLLDNLHLPSLEQLISTPRGKVSWKNSNKRLLNINHYIALTEECPNYPIGYCDLPLGKPSHHWSSTLHDRQATIRTNFRLRMLVGCDGLEADASRFRRRMNSTAQPLATPPASCVSLHLRTPPTSSCAAPPSPLAAVNYSQMHPPTLNRYSLISTWTRTTLSTSCSVVYGLRTTQHRCTLWTF